MSTLPRRKILKAAAATALGGMFAAEANAHAGPGATQDTENFGGWLSKAGGNKHIPVVNTARHGEEVEVSLEVKHPQGDMHHISNVRIYDEDRIEVATCDFNPTLSTPRATMVLRVPAGTKLYAVTNCNLHGLWYAEFEV